MKRNKRILALLISVLMITAIPMSAFASSGNETTVESLYEQSEDQADVVETAEQECQTQEDNKKEHSERANEPPESEYVAVLSVATRVNFDHGHAWLYIENLSDAPIQVGHYEVPVGEGVSVGLFASRNEGPGIYYNVEAYSVGKFNNKGVYSLSKSLTRKELEKVSKEIRDYLNYWGLYFNCTFFAYTIWNEVSSERLVPLLLPIIGIVEMLLYGAKTDVLEMYYPTEDEVLRQKGTGSNAYLEPVSEKTLSRSIA